MPTLEQLRGLCAIVEEGNFRRAAAQVHRSQPAVSQQLKALERSVGRTLIDRQTGQPTPAGQVLYQRAKRILLDVDVLRAELDDLEAHAERELRVGASDTTSLYLLPPYVRQFTRKLPRTRLILVSRSSDAIADLVERGDLHLGVVSLPLRRMALEEEPLFQQKLVLVLPARHPLAAVHRLSLKRLAQEPLLQLDPATRTGALLQRCFHDAHFQPRVVLDSGSFEVIKRYVAEGLGISFLPESVVLLKDKHLTARPLPNLPAITIGLIRRKNAWLPRAAHLFQELLRRK
ncbi:MAG: LysR family transcriptional regulator [Candidatus Hydrogenedentes bacterium]|nr:LysR family transcriptional regulator [Candidatus Hydrogenedentota bacterium]